MKKGSHIIIKGTVQGVFFRQFVKDTADKLGLKGFVRNLANGDVEAVVEGGVGNIEKMVEIVTKGPKHSIIKNVGVEERPWSGEFGEFKILRF